MGDSSRTLSGRSIERFVGRRRFLQSTAAAGAFGIAGCTGLLGGSDEEGVEYWTLFEGGDGDTMDMMVESANGEHDLTINVQRVPWDEYYDRLYTSLTSDEAPDVAVLHADRMLEYEELVRPLTDEIGTDLYVEDVAQRGVRDDEQLAAPLDTHPLGLYYNRDIFEEAGLDPDDPPNTPEKFQEACDTITENTDYWAGQYHAGEGTVAILRMFMASRDGSVLTEEFDPGFDNEDGVDIAEFMNSWANENDWVPQDSDTGWEAWQRGEAGFLIDGTWHIGVLQQVDFEWGLTEPFILPDSEEPMTEANSHLLAIPASNSRSQEREEEAIEAIQLLTQEYNYMWGTGAGHLPASQEALESDDLRESETWELTLNTFYDMVENGQSVAPPATPNNAGYMEEIYQQFDDMRLGNLEPQEAVDNAADGVRQVFD